jgi:hypothetical protein
MATLTKKNEAVQLPLFKNGVSLQFFEVTFPSDVSAKLSATTAGARSPVAVALEAISQVASVELIGTLRSGGTILPVAVAALGGNFGTATWDGTNSETFAAHLEDLVQATSTATSGWVTYQSVNLDSASVATGAQFS